MNSRAFRGRQFEQELEFGLEYYQRRGMAWITRLHVPKIVTQRGTIYVARTWTDLVGFSSDGRAILIEAKSIADVRRKKYTPDREHQLRMVQTAVGAGCLGLYLIRRGMEEVFLFRPQADFHYGDSVVLDTLPVIKRQWSESPWAWLEQAKWLGW